jgi:hypothetical protein
MSYDRNYLETAIPEATIEGTDPQGLLEGDAQQRWNDGYEEVLSVIRAEFLAGQDEFTEGQITDAVFVASEAWNTYCGFQGDVAATLGAVRPVLGVGSKPHVYAIPTGNSYVGEGKLIGDAATLDDALALIRSAGYTIIEEGNGGNYDRYDAEDAPGVFGYEADGVGAFGITIEPLPDLADIRQKVNPGGEDGI